MTFTAYIEPLTREGESADYDTMFHALFHAFGLAFDGCPAFVRDADGVVLAAVFYDGDIVYSDAGLAQLPLDRERMAG